VASQHHAKLLLLLLLRLLRLLLLLLQSAKPLAVERDANGYTTCIVRAVCSAGTMRGGSCWHARVAGRTRPSVASQHLAKLSANRGAAQSVSNAWKLAVCSACRRNSAQERILSAEAMVG
jgi:cytochrome c553